MADPPRSSGPRRLPRREQLTTQATRTVQLLRRTPPLVAAMAVLSVGLIGASGVLVKGVRRANDTITVTGASRTLFTLPGLTQPSSLSLAAAERTKISRAGVELAAVGPHFTRS